MNLVFPEETSITTFFAGPLFSHIGSFFSSLFPLSHLASSPTHFPTPSCPDLVVLSHTILVVLSCPIPVALSCPIPVVLSHPVPVVSSHPVQVAPSHPKLVATSCSKSKPSVKKREGLRVQR